MAQLQLFRLGRKLLQSLLSLLFKASPVGSQVLVAHAPVAACHMEWDGLGFEQLYQMRAGHIEQVRCMLGAQFRMYWDQGDSVALPHFREKMR